MAISWNEIKDRALHFTKEWEGESRERAEKDTFWNEFFHVFGITRRRVAIFEKHIKKLNNKDGYIDVFWPGNLLVEHKSKGKSLEGAFNQAADYFQGIKEHELPKYVLVSDFERFRLYDLDLNTEHEFRIDEFHENIKLFGFIAGLQKRVFKDEDPVNIKAAELMGKLHDQLEENGFSGHQLEVFLVRLLFCLFADDTGIFEKDSFQEFIEVKTNEDGSDLGALLNQFFQVLNTPAEDRQKNLDEHLAAFPYINGKLFEEALHIAAFNSQMREILLKCSALDWGKISPAIFGSMFQSVMNPEERRNLGAHYTSEKNILKLIKPLFLDELHSEFQKVKSTKSKLKEFHQKLGSLKFLDPACGCGNFLIITYRELRLLELEVLQEIYGTQQVIGIEQIMNIDVDQFYGIEYDEFPVRIAEVALWLMDHQMNLKVSEVFGLYYARLPLKKEATIIHGNALRTNWESIVPKSELSYILGNPPFAGKKEQSKEQKADLLSVYSGVKGAGVLDYVAAWHLLSAQYIVNTEIKVAFVSTNSIAQGEQVSVIWNELFHRYNIKIHFAHRTFKWKNEAKGNAAVHVVIIGFGTCDVKDKFIFEYENIQGEPDVKKAKNINPYLVEGQDLFIDKRYKPISNVPEIAYGSFALDDGNFTISEDEYKEIIASSPKSKKFLRPFIGGKEMLRSITRYCVWLKDADPKEIKEDSLILEKVKKVKEWRSKSERETTKDLANTPTLFAEIRQPDTDYLAFPTASSETRKYIPIAYLKPEIIASNQLYTIPKTTLYHFGILTSIMCNR